MGAAARVLATHEYWDKLLAVLAGRHSSLATNGCEWPLTLGKTASFPGRHRFDRGEMFAYSAKIFL